MDTATETRRQLQLNWFYISIAFMSLLGLPILAIYIDLVLYSDHFGQSWFAADVSKIMEENGKMWTKAAKEGAISFFAWVMNGLNAVYGIGCGPTFANKLNWELSSPIEANMRQCTSIGLVMALANLFSFMLSALSRQL